MFKFCCPYSLGCGAIHWSSVDFPGPTSLKKNEPPSLSSCQLPIAPQLGVKLCALLFQAGILSSVSLQRAWECYDNCCEFICATPLLCYKETLFFVVIYPLAFTINPSAPLSTMK